LQSAHDLLQGRVSSNVTDLARTNAILEEEVFERKQAESALRKSEEELRKLAGELKDADRRKDEFLAIVSHELRTPLTSMLAWATMLRKGKLGPSRAQRAFEIIERNIKVQTRLVEDLLDISRIVTGKLHLKFVSVNCRKVVEDAIESVRADAELKSIAIVSNLEEVITAGDPVRLQQIVWNLMFNAIKFTPEGGHVTVHLLWKASKVHLRITDNGIGIPQKLIPALFRRFSQGDSSASRQYGGLGLGLSIVHHLVEAHGGTIVVESAGVGKGAAFLVDLPILATVINTSKSDVDSALPAIEAIDLTGLLVLVVDDDSDSRDVVKVILEALGATVVAVGTCECAMVELMQQRPDILISDIGMPEMDGYQLIKSIRSLSDPISQIPALALTSYARPEERELALVAGFTLHAAKPIEPDDLASIVCKLAPSNKDTANP